MNPYFYSLDEGDFGLFDSCLTEGEFVSIAATTIGVFIDGSSWPAGLMDPDDTTGSLGVALADGTYSLTRRIICVCGQYGDASEATTVVISGGALVPLVPNVPDEVTVTLAADGTAVIRWSYDGVDQAISPTKFNIYIDAGSGFDYDTPDGTVTTATVRDGSQISRTWTTGELDDGVWHQVCVTAATASAESSPSTAVQFQPDATDPTVVSSFTASYEVNA